MTLRKLAEQVTRRYYAGSETDKAEVHRKEVQLMIAQEINSRLKVQHLNENFPGKEMVPPNFLIGNYTVPITHYEDGVDNIVCTPISASGWSNAWTTNAPLNWITTGGDSWGSYQEADVSITPVTALGVQTYVIRITGLTTPGDTSNALIKSAIEDCADDGYIQISGLNLDSGFPLNICSMGISYVSVTDTKIEITYIPSNVSGVSDEVSAACLASDNLFAAMESRVTFEDQRISNFSCCTWTVANKPAMITLPAQPIQLPRSVGIWRIYEKSTPFDQYIPVQSGQYDLLSDVNHNPLANALANMTVYTVHNNKELIFNQTVGNMPASVELQLLIVDPEKLGETDLLPIPADMEDAVVLSVLTKLRTEKPVENGPANN